MSTNINDNIKLQTGLGGNDGLASWFGKQPGECLNDAEFRWLNNIDTQNSGGINDMWFNILRSAGYIGSLDDMKSEYWESPITFPSELPNQKLWTRFNQGITVTGSGVSQWDDASGNGNHLKQGADTNRPSKEGDGSILFDGVDNFLKAGAITWNQPETVYLLFDQVSWTTSDGIFDGNADLSMLLNSVTLTPRLSLFAGTANDPETDSAVVGSCVALCEVFNGASSVVQVGSTTRATGNPGASNAGGFTLGRRAGAASSNIQVKEVIGYSTAHDAATRAKVIAYLSNVGGL